MELGKILLVGSTGYLGGHLANALELNVIARNEVMKQCREESFDTVIHSAHFNDFEAESEFINSFSPETYFVFFSSAAIYGETSLAGATVETEPNPINDYGRYKLKLEELVSTRFERHLILRISNPYGKEPKPKGVYQIFKAALANGEALNINADKQEAVIRDFIYIDSFIDKVRNLIVEQVHGYFNISSGFGLSLEDFVSQEFPDKSPEFNYLGFRESEIVCSVLRQD